MCVQQDRGEGGARNAGHRQLDQPDPETAANSRGLLAVASDGARLASQTVEGVLAGGAQRSRGGVSAVGIWMQLVYGCCCVCNLGSHILKHYNCARIKCEEGLMPPSLPKRSPSLN